MAIEISGCWSAAMSKRENPGVMHFKCLDIWSSGLWTEYTS